MVLIFYIKKVLFDKAYTFAQIIREIYIVNNLKTNILIKANILISKRIVIDFTT